MTMPSSVTGPDRRPDTEAAKRPGGRRAEGGADFGSALSAEMGRPGEDEREEPARTSDRAASSPAPGREAADRAAGTRDLASRAAAERAAAERAAVSRAATERAAISRASAERTADRAVANRAADRAADRAATERAADRAAAARAADGREAAQRAAGRDLKRPPVRDTTDRPAAGRDERLARKPTTPPATVRPTAPTGPGPHAAEARAGSPEQSRPAGTETAQVTVTEETAAPARPVSEEAVEPERKETGDETAAGTALAGAMASAMATAAPVPDEATTAPTAGTDALEVAGAAPVTVAAPQAGAGQAPAAPNPAAPHAAVTDQTAPQTGTVPAVQPGSGAPAQPTVGAGAPTATGQAAQPGAPAATGAAAQLTTPGQPTAGQPTAGPTAT
ncbi:hypothetical protein QLQ12_15120, partial [Actinoplanes sp. NEAU-A12]|nr:hypothetical protein [Actinoplanes sandaracinus]